MWSVQSQVARVLTPFAVNAILTVMRFEIGWLVTDFMVRPVFMDRQDAIITRWQKKRKSF